MELHYEPSYLCVGWLVGWLVCLSLFPKKLINAPIVQGPSVGYFVDRGNIVAVTNPDYNVEKMEIVR